MSKELVQIRGLCFSYDGEKEILRRLNLTVYEGDFVALIGKNGCGKTTLLKHLNGILKPTAGTVEVCGMDTAATPTAKLARVVGYCYQNPDHQIFNSTIRQEMEFGPKNIGMQAEEMERRIGAALETVGLHKPLEDYPFSLSKGERQKLAVASILTMETPILVVDEPSTGMDWQGSLAMMELMKRLNAQGHTLLAITHDMRFVARYAKRVLAMRGGEIIADCTPLELLGAPDVLRAASLTPPQIVRFLQALLPREGICLDVEQAARAICRAAGREAVKA